MGQVSNVSVLFTDLVGSTALSSSVSPEVADELRREHFGVLRRAVAEADGTEVKNLGDGLMVVFSTASAALACAVGMQQATESDNRGREVPFGLRVGVAAGEAADEDGDYFGDPVVEAARLCALCESGQILATDLVRGMAGRRNPHRCVPLGDLELKGLPEPVPAVEVTWEPLGAVSFHERVPLPARLRGRPAAGLVGRSTELESLADALKRAAGRGGREVVVVSGEAGLGKTTLVAEAARVAFDAGACVLFGHAEEDLATPYGIFAEAFGHLVTHASEDDLRGYVADCGSDLARIVPALTRRLPDVDPPTSSDGETERYLLYSAVVGLLRHVAAERPVVLVVDDLQWADTASLQLLRHVVGEDPTLAFLVLGTYRDTEVSVGHPLVDALAALWRMDRVARVNLQGLDDRGVVDLLEATAGHELDAPGVDLAHALYQETDGNPFFLSEVLRHLVETGALYRDDTTGRWVSDLTLEELRLPDSVREVVGARVARLGPHANRILSTAAVIGRDFDLELLTAATEHDEEDVLDLLEAAEAAALVREPASVAGRFSFTHALIQRTLYQDLSANRRARTHERVAEALEDLTAGRPADRVGELAHHWAQAMRPADAAKAIEYARRAGEAALDALAPDDAVRWFSEALDLATQHDTITTAARIDLHVGLGVAQRQAGLPDFRETLLDAARTARDQHDPERLARAALENNRGWFTSHGQVDTDKVEILEAALAALPDRDSPERARLLATLCAELTYGSPLERRLALADEAKAIARRLGDDLTFIEVVHRTSVSLVAPSTLDRQLADEDEASAAAQRLAAGTTVPRGSPAGYLLAIRAGRFERASQLLTERRALAEKLGQPALRWEATYLTASEALLHGDFARAEELATSALEIGTASGQPDAFGFYGIQLTCVRFEEGRYGETVPLLADAAAQNPAIPAYRAGLAMAHLHAEDEDAARVLLDELAASSFEFPEEAGWFDASMSCTRVVWELDARVHAHRLFELLAPYGDQMPHNGLIPIMPVATCLGALAALLERYDDAERYFTQASDLCNRGRMKAIGAETNLWWGQTLLKRDAAGDTGRARQLLEAARSTAARHGYARIERLASDQLSKMI